MRNALKGDTLVHSDLGSNVVYDWDIGDPDEIDSIMAGAHHVTEMDIRNNRLVPNPMETRSADRVSIGFGTRRLLRISISVT